MFKFMTSHHAAQLIEDERVWLPTLGEFRDQSKYSGAIADKHEGLVRLKPSDRANEPYDFEAPDCLVFCASSFVLSDSLEFALRESKEACVMIWDIERFWGLVSEALREEWTFAALAPCAYVKDDAGNLTTRSDRDGAISRSLAASKTTAALLKPESMSDQREYRAIFVPRADQKVRALSVHAPGIAECCIPITLDGMTSETVAQRRNSRGGFGGRVVGVEKAVWYAFDIEQPVEGFSPAALSMYGKYYVAMGNVLNKHMRGAHVRGGPAMRSQHWSVGMTHWKDYQFVASMPISELSHLEISV